MKAAVWHDNKDIRLEDVPTPESGPGEMLVKVHSCGICGSDVVEWYRRPRAPLVLGHEIGAEIVSVGEQVEKYKSGDRVFVAPKVPCLRCDYCRDGHYPVCPNVKERLPGGFAEYILVPPPLVERGTYVLPDRMTFDQSTFIEPLACVVRAQKLARVAPGRTVLVMGAGISGLLHVKLAKAKGCRVVATDVSRRRLELAEKYGADATFDAAENEAGLFAAFLTQKAETVILCTSAIPAIEQAWRCADKGGSIVFFAVPGPEKHVTFPVNYFWTREMRILTSYYCGPPDIVEAMDLIGSGAISVDEMITHRLPLKDTATGFRLVMDGRESIKVIIKPHEESEA